MFEGFIQPWHEKRCLGKSEALANLVPIVEWDIVASSKLRLDILDIRLAEVSGSGVRVPRLLSSS